MYLFGASGHAKVIIDILKAQNVEVKGLYDEDEAKKELWNIPVIGKTIEHVEENSPCIVSIGNNEIRKKVVAQITGAFGKAVHPSLLKGSNVEIGKGSVIMAGTVINADTEIGNHCIVNTSASIDHDCFIDDYAHIAPNTTVCGGVTIGEGTLLGAGSTVIPLIKIGKWCTIGAGAVIKEDVPDYAVVVGNPGRVIKYRKP